MSLEWLYISPIILEHRRRSAEARNQANKYAQVENELGAQIAQLEKFLESAETLGRKQYVTFMTGEGTAEGQILTQFEIAVNNWNNKYKNLLNYMNNELQVLRMRKTTAAQLKSQYEEQARMEEMMGNG